MKLGKKNLRLKEGIGKEWIIVNGLGGFASSSVLGANTRRYHGLLLAPLIPPAKRYLLLSKLDETLKVGDKTYNLFTNVCSNYISDGHKYIESFEKDVIPKFTFDVNGIKIIKQISFVYGRNTIVCTYEIKNLKENAYLTLTPVISFRDFHGMYKDHKYSLNQKINRSKVRVEVDGNGDTPIYMYVSGAAYYQHIDDTFENMYYLKEDERGFPPEENLAVPGRYEIYLEAKKNYKFTFVASLEENIEEIDGFEVIKEEIDRINRIIDTSELLVKGDNLSPKQIEYNNFIRKLILASDSFIIFKLNFGLYSILAGIPWFLDWGRDSLIAYEGLTLLQKRNHIARSVMLACVRDIKFGLVPNGYSGYDNRPLYNSVDSSLLLFEQVNKYLDYTNDYEFIKENIYEKLKQVYEHYIKGIDVDNNNIYMDTEDGLIYSGTPDTQNTWMDVKIDGEAITPRNGKVVEINALWYNALKTLEALAKRFNDPKLEKECKNRAKKTKTVFNEKFYNEKKKCLYDVLGDSKVRPNQLFAFSTKYPVWEINDDKTLTIMNTIEEKLLMKRGLKSLAKGEKNYVAEYSGDAQKRDRSYHQGPTWVWLIGLYYDALKNVIKETKDSKLRKDFENRLKKLIIDTYETFKVEIDKPEGIGNISELYDSKAPFKSGGTPAQAWSVSEVLRIVNEYRNYI